MGRKVEGSSGDFRIVFEPIAGNTVLMETWFSGSSKHSLTVYHVDNGRLIATHYCPQGNQPRLEAHIEAGADTFSFKYFDATGLESAEESHQRHLSIHFDDPNGVLTRFEMYLNNGVEETSSLTLVRDR